MPRPHPLDIPVPQRPQAGAGSTQRDETSQPRLALAPHCPGDGRFATHCTTPAASPTPPHRRPHPSPPNGWPEVRPGRVAACDPTLGTRFSAYTSRPSPRGRAGPPLACPARQRTRVQSEGWKGQWLGRAAFEVNGAHFQVGLGHAALSSLAFDLDPLRKGQARPPTLALAGRWWLRLPDAGRWPRGLPLRIGAGLLPRSINLGDVRPVRTGTTWQEPSSSLAKGACLEGSALFAWEPVVGRWSNLVFFTHTFTRWRSGIAHSHNAAERTERFGPLTPREQAAADRLHLVLQRWDGESDGSALLAAVLSHDGRGRTGCGRGVACRRLPGLAGLGGSCGRLRVPLRAALGGSRGEIAVTRYCLGGRWPSLAVRSGGGDRPILRNRHQTAPGGVHLRADVLQGLRDLPLSASHARQHSAQHVRERLAETVRLRRPTGGSRDRPRPLPPRRA